MTTPPRGIFVVGTDTDVGKTRVAASIARGWMGAGHRIGVIKPVSTGGVSRDGRWRSTDADALIAAIATADSPFPPPPHDRVAPLVYPLPLAPTVAAREAGTPLRPATLVEATRAAIAWWADEAHADLLVIEGVGGLLCPIAEDGWTVADLAHHLDYPLVIVAHRGLGTLNQTLMTAEIARSRGLRVAGLILNGARPTLDPLVEATNAAVLTGLLPWLPILAEWSHQPDSGSIQGGSEVISWIDLAKTPRRSPDGLATGSGDNLRADRAFDLDLPSTSDIDVLVADRSALEISSSSSDAHAGLGLPGSAANSPPTFAGLDLDLGPKPPSAARPRIGAGAEDDGTEVSPGRNQTLLISYASAVTLALAWILYQGRSQRIPAAAVRPEPVAAVGADEEGKLAGESRRVEASGPIAADRMIDLGRSRQVGSLLIKPLTVDRRSLILERTGLTGKTERRDGGKRAVVLQVQLQNQSPDQVFVPVDPAFVRNRADDVSETFLHLDDGRKLYPNALAVDSEWSLVGQSFAVLRPGEARDVIFTTEANAPADAERLAGVWRIKLRTSVDSIALIGIRLPDRRSP